MTEHPDAAGDSAASGASPEQPPPAAAPPDPQQVTLRRAPRYRAFIISGAVFGVVLAAVLMRLFPDDGDFTGRAVFGYLAVALGLLGGLLGGVVAVLLEHPRRR